MVNLEIENDNLIHKNVIYNHFMTPLEEIAQLNDVNPNAERNIITIVNDIELEDCIKTILKSNPNVIFYAIQYSIVNKKICFYTNSKISLEAWEKKYANKYQIQKKKIISDSDLMEEIETVLGLEDITNSNCVSLYEIIKIMRSTIMIYIQK